MVSDMLKQPYSLSFYNFLVKFSEWHRGRGRVKLTKCDKVEWGENEIAPRLICYLAVFWEHISFNFKRVEIRKMSEVFWAKLYCKMSDLFLWFLLALRFYATNSGIKIRFWWCPVERVDYSCTPGIIFSKKGLQIGDFESFIFWSKFRFLGYALRCFGQCFF